MNDLISRQAAIDMFQNLAYDDWNQGASTTWSNAFSEAAEMIRDLPSAEPEIIRCKDCKLFEDPKCMMQWECYDWAEPDGFCHMAERRTDG